MISRQFVMLYSILCYLAGFAALVYAIGFVGDVVAPKTLDSGVAPDRVTALAIDLPLLALFAIQHSVMARQGFKRWWTRIVPKPSERATYVLFAAATLGLIYWQWRPIPATVWSVNDANAAMALMALYFAGWAIVFISTFLIDHFELMGLHQSFAHLRGRAAPEPRFKTPLFYRLVRHPIYTGLLIAFWATPRMSEGHLVFALATTGYIFIGIALEERDLVLFFGDAYRDYRRRVPMVIPLPRFGGRKQAPAAQDAAR